MNKRRAELDAAIHAEFPELAEATFDWRSPVAPDRYREYSDVAFLRCVRQEQHVEALAQFWPTGGPRWDALAVVDLPNEDPGVLLVEGKSYPAEMLKGSPLGADVQADSRRRIEKAIAWTQGWLGLPLEDQTWTGRLYQNGNRLAHLCFLQSQGVPAWLVHLLFTEDPHSPTTRVQWEEAIRDVDAKLGHTAITIGNVGYLILPAGTRDELLA